jgi:pimeloyl-ACP methyl ester carboxylesterase
MTRLVLGAVGLLVSACLAGGADVPAAPRHVIYLHGRIVQEQQSARPQSPEFGYYELEKILVAFRNRGFVVTGEVRPKGASVGESVDRVVEQVRRLLDSGVPAERIAVVGASMGGGIAVLASARLQNPELRFGVLGVCFSKAEESAFRDSGLRPAGRILAIREASDELTKPCPPWKAESEPRSGVVVREMVINSGLRHGFLYRPLPEWLEPVVEWIEAPRRDDGSPLHEPPGGP